MVYRGGLENRFGFAANGGSNPSPSARNSRMKPGYLVTFVVVATVFAILWRKGLLLRFSDYVAETKVELKKCTWPSVDELKGSTLVVLVSTLLLAVFTVLVDYIIVQLMRLING